MAQTMRCISLEKGSYPDHTTKWMNPDNIKPEPVTREQICQAPLTWSRQSNKTQIGAGEWRNEESCSVTGEWNTLAMAGVTGKKQYECIYYHWTIYLSGHFYSMFYHKKVNK